MILVSGRDEGLTLTDNGNSSPVHDYSTTKRPIADLISISKISLQALPNSNVSKKQRLQLVLKGIEVLKSLSRYSKTIAQVDKQSEYIDQNVLATPSTSQNGYGLGLSQGSRLRPPYVYWYRTE